MEGKEPQRSVLIITYYWPPSGGPGVQRMLKFAKYLPEFGWQPIILTVDGGEFPAIDKSLDSDIPDSVLVYRAPIWEPGKLYRSFVGMKQDQPIPVAAVAQDAEGWKKKLAKFIRLNVFIPDAKRGWIRRATAAGREVIKLHKPDLILSSSPPPTVHLIARKLKHDSHLPWIADLRDPWSNIHYYQGRRLAISAYLDRKLEERTLAAADSVITVSKKFRSLLCVDPSQVEIITNGVDEDDFRASPKENKEPEGKFKIAYIGGLNENRYYPSFFSGLADFVRAQGLDETTVELTLAGSIHENYLNEIKALIGSSVTLRHLGYISHDRAIDLMIDSTLVLLFLEKVANYEGHIPGKLFEYLMSGTHILGLGAAGGEAADIIRKKNAGHFLDPNDDISDTLSTIYERWKENRLTGASPESISMYTRRALTRKLVKIFENL